MDKRWVRVARLDDSEPRTVANLGNVPVSV